MKSICDFYVVNNIDTCNMVNKSSPKSFGKSTSLPFMAEIGLARVMCY